MGIKFPLNIQIRIYILYYLKNSDLFKIYPNPTADRLTIENIDFNLDADYVIVDEIGREIMKGKLNGKSTIINVNSLSKGVYVLSIKDGLKRFFKFIKN